MTTGTLATDVPRVWPIRAGLAAMVCLYAVLAYCIAPDTYMTMAVSYCTQAALSIPVVIIPALLIHALVTAPKAPAAQFFANVKTGGFGGLKVIVGFVIGISAFSALKNSIPEIVPFYADPVLYRIDHFLHGGDPWIFTHAVLPVWAEYPLASLYGGFWFMIWFGTLIVVAFWDDRERRAHYLWAHALVVATIGTGLALVFSSYGPIFTDRVGDNAAYAQLLVLLDQSTAGQMIRQNADYLFSNYQAGDAGLGTGISAMPSMHVAVATLNACLFMSINRWLGVAGWTYTAVILFGSVYFAWHYAIDGYVSILVVLAIWFGVGRILARRKRFAQVSAT